MDRNITTDAYRDVEGTITGKESVESSLDDCMEAGGSECLELQGYLRTHLFLARAERNNPGQRSLKTIDSAIRVLVGLDYPEERARQIIHDAANKKAFLQLLGPYFI